MEESQNQPQPAAVTANQKKTTTLIIVFVLFFSIATLVVGGIIGAVILLNDDSDENQEETPAGEDNPNNEYSDIVSTKTLNKTSKIVYEIEDNSSGEEYTFEVDIEDSYMDFDLFDAGEKIYADQFASITYIEEGIVDTETYMSLSGTILDKMHDQIYDLIKNADSSENAFCSDGIVLSVMFYDTEGELYKNYEGNSCDNPEVEEMKDEIDAIFEDRIYDF